MQNKSQKSITSKEMHNLNAFRYLSKIKISLNILNNLSGLPDFQVLLNEISNCTEFDPSIDYAAKFTELFEYIEENHNALASDDFDDFIISIYENHNPNLEETYDLIQDQVVNTSHKRPSPEESVGSLFNWAPQDILSVHPTREEGLDRRFQSVYGKDFTPQSRTNMPYVLQSGEGQKMQLHFGTQARRLNDEEQISNTFELYLQAKLRKNRDHRHLYINKLGLDREQLPDSYRPKIYHWASKVLEGVREYFLTKTLHEFADRQPNLYMVTLPADKGNMNPKAYKKHNDEISLTDAEDIVLDVLNNPSDINNPDGSNIKDFCLGQKVQELLYPANAEQTREELHEQMITKSTEFLGLANHNPAVVSTAEQQALFFHTFAFQFTDQLLEAVNADSWNCSCKDAIDRGKAHYAYYNLVKSFTYEGMTPWTFDQFNKALHGTSTMVKGRGMNKHHKIVWNAIDVYVSNNYAKLVSDPQKQWLIEWRNLNCPIERVNVLLDDTIAKAEAATPILEENEESCNYYTGVLEFVKENKTKNASDNQVLLTALTTSMAVTRTDYSQDKAAQKRHQHIIEQLPQETTKMAWLKGMLTALYGIIARNKEAVTKGISLMNGVSNLEELNQQVNTNGPQ